MIPNSKFQIPNSKFQKNKFQAPNPKSQIPNSKKTAIPNEKTFDRMISPPGTKHEKKHSCIRGYKMNQD